MKCPLLFIILFALFMPLHATHASEALVCKSEGDFVVIDFGNTSPPTYFVLRTPDDRTVYLRYPPKGIDVFGAGYSHRLKLDVRKLKGYSIFNGQKEPAPAFVYSGKYELLFQDANTIAGQEIRTLSCSVAVSLSKGAKILGK